MLPPEGYREMSCLPTTLWTTTALHIKNLIGWFLKHPKSSFYGSWQWVLQRKEGWREDNQVLMSPPSHSLLSPRTREIWAEIKLLISNRSTAEGKVAVQGCIWCKHKTYARQCLIQTHLNAGYILFQFGCKTQLWKKCDTEKWKKKTPHLERFN